MNPIVSRSLSFAVVLFAAFAQSHAAMAATRNAASCSQTDVQSAINSAANGDLVTVPSGSCTWNSLSISKGIHVSGAGASQSIITLTGSGTLSPVATVSIEISGFRFLRTQASRAWTVHGSVTNKPVLFHDNDVRVTNNGEFFRWEVNNGVIFKNTFTCTWDESVLQHKNDADTLSWTTVDTLGSRDTNGDKNLYVEDNTWNNCTNQGMDFDDSSRSVVRYNVFNNSSWNSHGFATSPIGNRHFEIYGNQFNQQDPSVNQNWQIWIRGGTGVIFNNYIQDLNGVMWGNKPEIQLSVRAASDGGGQYPGGCCTTYPCIRQLGQNYSASSQFTDPIYIWNNTGGYAVTPDQEWGTCGGAASKFMQSGRDYVMAAPRPGYTPYTYPHPLRTDALRPSPPSALNAQ